MLAQHILVQVMRLPPQILMGMTLLIPRLVLQEPEQAVLLARFPHQLVLEGLIIVPEPVAQGRILVIS